MLIAVTSQNFRTITSHAGKARRFIVFEGQSTNDLKEAYRLELPVDMSLHASHQPDHPLHQVDVLITGSAGSGLVARLARQGVDVVICGETDPVEAARLYLSGAPLKMAEPHDEDHHHIHSGEQSGQAGHRCGQCNC